MNLYHLFIILFSVGISIVAFPYLMTYPLFSLKVVLFLPNEFYTITLAIGSALMGGGIGCGVGYLFYRKEKDGSNDE